MRLGFMLASLMSIRAMLVARKTLKSQLGEERVEVIMCILSNYTPECIVRSEVRCALADLDDGSGVDVNEFARKFQRAVRIAEQIA